MAKSKKGTDAPPNVALMGFMLVMAIAALVAEAYTLSMFFKSRSVASWPTVEGEVTRSELKSEFLGRMQYEAVVEYRYVVAGVDYTSNSVRVRGASNRRRSDIEAVVKRFPVGARVPVHYRPSNPGEAYLEVGTDFVNYVLIVSPLAFAGAFGYGFVDGLRKWRDRTDVRRRDPSPSRPRRRKRSNPD